MFNRTPEEFAEGHLENAVNIDYKSDTFKNEVDKLDRNGTYLIYCLSSRRSRYFQLIMKEKEFMEVYNMLGGILGWEDEGYAIVEK